MNFNLKTAIGSIAPTLATMLGGPLAGTAVTALEGVFGLSTAAGGADGVTAAVAAGMTPDQVAAIRAADQKHLEVIQEQGIDLDKMNLDFQAAQEAAATADRDSARKMQIANHSVMPAILTTVLTVGFFAVLLAKLANAFPNSSDPIVNQMIGTLLAVWTASVAYWVGTTRNSFDKTQLLAQSTPPGAAPAPTAVPQ